MKYMDLKPKDAIRFAKEYKAEAISFREMEKAGIMFGAQDRIEKNEERAEGYMLLAMEKEH